VTHTKQATGAIAVDGGTNVVIIATGETTGTINVGATFAPTGSIGINSTGAASVAATDATRGTITTKGGTNVAIETHATSSSAAAAADTAGATITQGAVSVTGTSVTTAVSVKQDMEVDEVMAVVAAAGANETAKVTFTALLAGETVTVDGLTFTAAKSLTAAQVAAAFANLSKGATQGSAPAGNGVYSGTSSALYTSGAVTTAGTVSTVTFTSVAKADATDVAVSGTGTGAGTTVSITAGSAAVDAVTGELGVVAGAVTVNGAITGTDVLATVSLDSYGTSTVASDALTSLSLANSDNGVTVTNTAATTLALAVDNLATGSSVDIGTKYTTLNITTSGTDSDVTLVAGGVQALTVAGTKAIDLSGATLTALKTVTITGSAGVTADVSGIATVTSVDASGTSGANTFSIDAATAAYTGGSGADKVTLSTATTTKAVSLGAGDDSLTLATGTASLTAAMTGGDGTDTLVMVAANAATASATGTFESKIDGFEKLSLTGSTTDVVDLSNMDDISYVISAGTTTSLTLNKMASGGTLELTGASAGTTTVSLTDATGTTDSLNVVAKVSTADINFGTVAAAGVESIAITATDTSTKAAINTATLALTDAALKTVTVTGNANLTLTAASSVALTSLDGSAMTGKLVASTNGTVAETITGGSAADTLTAIGNADVLLGGAGNDTLAITGNLATLTGGAGADTFNVSDATSNSSDYATITDLASGDKIQFTAGADSFVASKVTLADTAIFQDYANQAIALTDNSDVSWFQWNGNTYIIENVSNGTSFLNGTDVIVRITGAVDLSTASFSSSADTLLIA
jgi:S-layer protein